MSTTEAPRVKWLTGTDLARVLEAVGDFFTLYPNAHARFALARNQRGDDVATHAVDACAWCLVGAVRALLPPLCRSGAIAVPGSANNIVAQLNREAERYLGQNLPGLNDLECIDGLDAAGTAYMLAQLIRKEATNV